MNGLALSKPIMSICPMNLIFVRGPHRIFEIFIFRMNIQTRSVYIHGVPISNICIYLFMDTGPFCSDVTGEFLKKKSTSIEYCCPVLANMIYLFFAFRLPALLGWIKYFSLSNLKLLFCLDCKYWLTYICGRIQILFSILIVLFNSF